MRYRRLLYAFLPVLALTILLASSSAAQAATFTVNSTADTGDSDATPEGTCDDGSGNCTLREAIQEAEALAGADTINFNIPGAGPHTIQLTTALPVITQDLGILNASGEGITVKGEGSADPYSVFIIFNSLAAPDVTIGGLTISNGHAPAAAAAS